jgi:hypothetical protein
MEEMMNMHSVLEERNSVEDSLPTIQPQKQWRTHGFSALDWPQRVMAGITIAAVAITITKVVFGPF